MLNCTFHIPVREQVGLYKNTRYKSICREAKIITRTDKIKQYKFILASTLPSISHYGHVYELFSIDLLFTRLFVRVIMRTFLEQSIKHIMYII